MLPSLPNVSEDMYWILPGLVEAEGESETMSIPLAVQCGLATRTQRQKLRV